MTAQNNGIHKVQTEDLTFKIENIFTDEVYL
jgi:hypothetical protein